MPQPPAPNPDPPLGQEPRTRWPLQDINSPNQRDGYYIEIVSEQDSAYQRFTPIARGTPYSQVPGADTRIIAQYAANPLYFLKQIADIDSMRVRFNSVYDNFVLWIWATDSQAQDTYNSTVTYEEDGVSFPVFVREYEIRRKDWEANPTIAPDSTLTSLLSVQITAAGTGYAFASGTLTGGAACEAVILNGAIVDWVVTKEGAAIVAGQAVTIVGDGTGASATARVQPLSAVLISQQKEELPESDPKSHDYVKIIRTYATMPGPILTTKLQSEDVRGREVDVTIQKGLTGTLAPETGDNIISSETQPISTVVEQRTTKKVASLPADQVWAEWHFVPIPLLLFDIVNTFFCNNSQFFTVVTNPVTSGGSSALRKHRITRKYWNSTPNPDLSASSITMADVRYSGKAIQFAYSNVLNDALSYTENFYNSSSMAACFWTEAYDFPATTPSATAFLAGLWIVRDFQVKDWGESGYITELTEYYSAEGNPSL